MKDVGFRIDPEFEGKIPPIGPEEFAQLRENILAAGEVYEPLVIWDGTLVDGHNRWKIIQEAPHIKWRVREMSFPDKWGAFEWMYKNQLGRRNLTDEQRTYTIGKMYEARKNSIGGNRGTNRDETGRFTTGSQNGSVRESKPKWGTDNAIAEELGVGRNTVNRAAKFAKGVDVLREFSPEAADRVLSGKAPVTKSEVAEIPEMEHEDVAAVADEIMKPNVKRQKHSGRTKADRELAKIISAAVASQTSEDGAPAFSVDQLISEIEVNGESYVRGLRNTIVIRTDLLRDDDAKVRVFKAIANIIQDIVRVRSEFCK